MEKQLLRHVGTVLIATGLLFNSQLFRTHVMAECYMVTGSGYRSMGGASRLGPYATLAECEAVRENYSMGGYCECDDSASGYGSSGGYSGYGGYGGATWEEFSFHVMQNLMQEFWTGFNTEMERQRQLQEQQALERERWLEQRRLEMQRREREEAEKRRQEAERKKQAQQKLLIQMRDTGTALLEPRDLSGLPRLEVEEDNGDIFGIKTLKPRDLSQSTQVASVDTDLRISNCAAFLLKMANRAASEGDYHEAAYHSNEASDLLSGVKDTPSVQCPGVPDFKAGPVQEWQDKADEFKKGMIFFSKLYSRANEQAEDYRQIQKSVQAAENKVDAAKKGQEAAQARLEELQAQKEQEPEAVDESAMAEALAALKEAQEVFAESEKDLSDMLEAREKIEENLNETLNMSDRVVKHPDKIDEMLEQLNQKPPKEG